MRLFKLAIRMVVAQRGTVFAAVATLAFVAAAVTLAGSAYRPVHAGVTRAFRTRLRGELAGATDSTSVAELVDRASAVDALVSAAREEPGALDTVFDLLLVTVRRVDLPTELRFRGMDELLETFPSGIASGDALLLTAPDTRPDEVYQESAPGRVGRLATAAGTELVRVLDVAPGARDGTELLIHDVNLAEVLAAKDRTRAEVRPAQRSAPDAAARSADGSSIAVRVRGRARPLSRQAVAALMQVMPTLEETGWQEAAAIAVAPLTRSVRVLVILLVLLAGGTLVPGQLLLARRSAPAFALLCAWGFPRSACGRLVVVVGAVAAVVAAGSGAGVGLIVAAILNARGRPALEILPLDLDVALRAFAGDLGRVELPEAGASLAVPDLAVAVGTVTPVVGWAAVCVGVAALLGVVTALPSARFAATLRPRRGLWHW